MAADSAIIVLIDIFRLLVRSRGAGLGDWHGDLLVAMLLKRRFSEQGAAYPDEADRPCGSPPTLKADRSCVSARVW